MADSSKSIPTWEDSIPTWEDSSAPAEDNTPTWEGSTPTWEESSPDAEIKKGGLLASEFVTDKEIDAIAKKHGVDRNELESWVPWFGALRDEVGSKGATDITLADLKDIAKGGAAIAGSVLSLGSAQKLAKMTQDENTEKALDELQSIIGKKRSYLIDALDLFGGAGVAAAGAKAATRLGARATIGAGAAEGAIAGAAQSEAGEELEGAAIGAGLGGALGGTLDITLKAAKKFKDKAIKNAAERLAKDSVDLESKVQTRLAEEAPRIEAEQKAVTGEPLTDQEMIDLVGKDQAEKVLTLGTDESKILQDALTSRGEAVTNQALIEELADQKRLSLIDELGAKEGENLSELMDVKQRERIALEEVAKLGPKDKKPKAFNIIHQLALKFSDANPVSKTIDAKHGTDFNTVLVNGSAKHNEYTIQAGDHLDKLTKVVDQIKKSGLDHAEVIDLYESGVLKETNSELADTIQAFYDNALESAIDGGLDIQKRANYIPARRLETSRYLVALEDKAKEISSRAGVDLANLTDDQFNRLKKDKDFKELLYEIEFQTNKEMPSAEDFSASLMNTLEDVGRVSNKLGIEASAAKARDDSIPSWVREKNFERLAAGWITNTFRTIHLGKTMKELDRLAKITEARGDDFASKYIKNLALDIQGTRRGTLASGTKKLGEQFRRTMRRKAADSTNALSKYMYEAGAETPDFLNFMSRNVYRNYLGANPKSVIQNLASPMLFTLPEAGRKVGAAAWLSANLKIMAAKLFGTEITLSPALAKKLGKEPGALYKTNDLNLIAQNAGFLPKQWEGETVSALKGTLEAGLPKKIGRKINAGYDYAMMRPFELSETHARAQVYYMSQEIGKKVMQDPKLASEFISGIDSPSFRRDMRRAYQAQDAKEMQKLIGQHMNAGTLFNYDKLNMSAYGRYMGPLFSVFSKWPTSIVGKVLHDTYDRGALRGLGRNAGILGTPFVTMALIDQITKDEDSDLYKRVVGSGGLKDWTPADSLVSLGEDGLGGIFESPALSTLGTAWKASTSGDSDVAVKALDDMWSTFGYSAGLLRFLGEDVPIYRGKDKPTGLKLERRLKEIERQLK